MIISSKLHTGDIKTEKPCGEIIQITFPRLGHIQYQTECEHAS